MDKRLLVLFLIFILLAAGYFLIRPASAPEKKEKLEYRTSLLMTSLGNIPIEITAHGLDVVHFRAAVKNIRADVAKLSKLVSVYNETSLISQLNRGEAPPSFPREVWEMVRAAQSLSELTEGVFDISIGPLRDLWEKCAAEGRLPTAKEKRDAIARVGFDKYEAGLNPEDKSLSVKLFGEGVELDLGGVAKGWFADRALEILKKFGATRVIVDIGGDMALWDQSSSAGFSVGIRHPLNLDRLFASLELPSGSVATSGGYYRFYEIEGKQYCHIFDPRTGEPAEGLLSVTVFAPSGIQADALATAVFVMGAEEGLGFVEEMDGIEAAIIKRQEKEEGYEILISRGLVGKVALVEKK